jgi:hypothetical protein
MQNGKLQRQRLTGRQTAFTPDTLFFLATIGTFKSKHNFSPL